VLTARGERPRLENNFEKELVNATLGLSSATTTHVRTHARLTPRCCQESKELSSIINKLMDL